MAVQDYITRRLQSEHDQIEEDERLVRQYRDETQKMRGHIEQLKTTYDTCFTGSDTDRGGAGGVIAMGQQRSARTVDIGHKCIVA